MYVVVMAKKAAGRKSAVSGTEDITTSITDNERQQTGISFFPYIFFFRAA